MSGPWVAPVTQVGAEAAQSLKFDGSGWSTQAAGSTAFLNAVWGTNANNVWAVGSNGTILKWDGSVWSAQTSNTTECCRRVGNGRQQRLGRRHYCTIISGMGALGAKSTAANGTLFSVWGTDANNVWAGGLGSTILQWNGSVWSPQSSGTRRAFDGVWGTDANNVWAVGWDGAIRKWNGSAWDAQSSGTGNSLYGVWGADANNIWAVGVKERSSNGTETVGAHKAPVRPTI